MLKLMATRVLLLALCSLVALSIVGRQVRGQWTPTNGPNGGQVTALLTTPGALFAGTQTNGIFRSTDGGYSWQPSDNGLSWLGVNVFCQWHGTVFAGTGGGIYRSTDLGEHWDSCNGNFGTYYFTALFGDSEGTFFASTGSGATAQYFSVDSGRDWSTLDFSGGHMVAFAEVGDTIFAATDNGLYASTDEGGIWTPVIAGPAANALLVENGILYAAGYGTVWQSSDRGADWQELGGSLPGPNISPMTLSFANGALVAGTDSGIYRWNDSLHDWTPINKGLGSLNIWSLTANRDTVFAGTSFGLYRFANAPPWTLSDSGITACAITSLAVVDTLLFAGTYRGGFFRSSDDGATWSPCATQFDFDSTIWTKDIIQDSNGVLYALSWAHALFRSTDSGTTWTKTSGYLSTYYTYSLCAVGTRLFAGTEDGLFSSRDSGESWQLVRSPSQNKGFYDFVTIKGEFFSTSDTGILRSLDTGQSWSPVVSPMLDSIVYRLSFAFGDLFAATNGGIARSTDLGSTWEHVNTGIPLFGNWYLPFEGLVAAGQDIIILIDSETFISQDSGSSWQPAGTLPIQWSPGNIAANDRFVFEGSGGASVWRRPISDFLRHSSIAPRLVTLAPMLVYPDPTPGPVTFCGAAGAITVTNVLGEDVAGSGNRVPGSGEAQIDLSKLPAGIYYARIETSNGPVVRKIIRR